MEPHVAELESDIVAIKIDLAVLKVNGATKSAISALRNEIADTR
jgi:hypothetical protein